MDVIVHGHPLQAVKQDLVLHGQCVELRLEGLSEADVTARFPGSTVPARLAHVLHRRTEGLPLFMVQTADAWVQQGWVTEVAGQWVVQVAVETLEGGVPESVWQMIAQQCDGLHPAEQEVLAAASTAQRTQHELDVYIALGPTLMATKGWAAPEVEQIYSRAQALCQQAGETPQRFAVLEGMRSVHFVRGALQTARELEEEQMRLAQRLQDPTCLLAAHRNRGLTLYWMGEPGAARRHLEQSLAFYDPQRHRTLAFLHVQDRRVVSLSYLAYVLWWLGYPDQAVQQSQAALTWARELAHAPSLAFAVAFATQLTRLYGDNQGIRTHTEALMTLATEHGFAYWLAVGTVRRGWWLAA